MLVKIPDCGILPPAVPPGCKCDWRVFVRLRSNQKLGLTMELPVPAGHNIGFSEHQDRRVTTSGQAVLFCLMFFFCLGPVLNSISQIVDFIFITALLLSLYQIVWVRRSPPQYIKIFLILVPVFLYLLVSVAIAESGGLFDLVKMVLKPVRILITVVGGVVLASLFIRLGYSYATVYLFLYLTITFHAAIMICQLFFPDFKDFVYSYTTNIASAGIEGYSYGYNFRMGGLAGGFGSSTLSVTQAFGIVLLPFLAKNQSLLFRIFLYSSATLIFASVILSGRSGLLCILLFYPIAVGLAGKGDGLGSSIKVVFSISAIFMVVAGVVVWIGMSAGLETTERARSYEAGSIISSDIFWALHRTFQTLLEAEASGQFSDNSINTLMTHLVLPDRMEVLALGDAEHLVNSHFGRALDSDIGYIRNIWSMGIFLAFAYWLPYFYFAIKAFKRIRLAESAKVLLLILVITLFFHAKEDILYSRILLSYLAVILGLFYLEANRVATYVRH